MIPFVALAATALLLTACSNDDENAKTDSNGDDSLKPSDTGGTSTDSALSDSADVYFTPQFSTSFEVSGQLTSVFSNGSSLSYISQFDGSNNGSTVIQPKFELGVCQDVLQANGNVSDEVTCRVLATLPFDPTQAVVDSSAKVLEIEGQQIVAIPYHSFPKTSNQGDSDVGQSSTSSQGVLLYDQSGTLLKNLSLEGLSINDYPVTGAQDVLYLEETGELVIACSNYASFPDSADTQTVKNISGTAYPPSALVYVSDPLKNPTLSVLPLVTKEGKAFYNVAQIEESGDRILATAILGQEGKDSQIISLNPAATSLNDSDDYLVVSHLQAGSGYGTTMTSLGDLLVSGEAASDDVMILSLLDSVGSLKETSLPADWSFITGAVEYSGGLIVSGQLETVVGQSSDMSALWYQNGTWTDMEMAKGLFGHAPVVLTNDQGSQALAISTAKTVRNTDGSWSSTVNLYQ